MRVHEWKRGDRAIHGQEHFEFLDCRELSPDGVWYAYRWTKTGQTVLFHHSEPLPFPIVFRKKKRNLRLGLSAFLIAVTAWLPAIYPLLAVNEHLMRVLGNNYVLLALPILATTFQAHYMMQSEIRKHKENLGL